MPQSRRGTGLPPLVSVSSGLNDSYYNDDSRAGNGSGQDRSNRKPAWGGASARPSSQVHSSIVSSDGSLMPKPGEMRQIFTGTPSVRPVEDVSSVSKSPMAPIDSATSVDAGSGTSEWDSRERGGKARRFRSTAKSSIAAAAAAAEAAASKAPLPCVSISSVPYVNASLDSGKLAMDASMDAPKLNSLRREPDSLSLTANHNIQVTMRDSPIVQSAVIDRGESSIDSFRPQNQSSSRNTTQQNFHAFNHSGKKGKIGNFSTSVPSMTRPAHSQNASVHSAQIHERELNRHGRNIRKQQRKFIDGPETLQWRNAENHSNFSASSGNTITKNAHLSSLSDSQPMGNDTAGTLSREKNLELELENERKLRKAAELQCLDERQRNDELIRKIDALEETLNFFYRTVPQPPPGTEAVGPNTEGSSFLQSLGIVRKSGPGLSSSLSEGNLRSGMISLSKSEASSARPDTVASLIDELVEDCLDRFSHETMLWSEAKYPLDDRKYIEIEYEDTVLRPQSKFSDDVAMENSDAPFIPKLRFKPHALVPLNQEELASTPWRSPFREEIASLDYQPWQLQRPQVIRPRLELDDFPICFVSEKQQLDDMMEKICGVHELAVGTEYHAYRSYHGFLCLVQISTRNEDFLVDALALREHLWVLNDVFTDPNTVKVLHSSDMDVLWLQKDLGVYFVNMFDTSIAARELGYLSFTYSYLLDRFFRIRSDTAIQNPDWRVRPLPANLCDEARQQTHYLLDIYDHLRCELLDRDRSLVGCVLQRSAGLCELAYVKDTASACHDRSTSLMFQLSRKLRIRLHSIVQQQCFLMLVAWRDRVARLRDESVQYVLDDASMFFVARDCPTSLTSLRKTLHSGVGKEVSHLLFNLRGYLFFEIATVISNCNYPDASKTSPGPV